MRSVYLAPYIDPLGIVIAGEDEVLRPEWPSIEAEGPNIEARRVDSRGRVFEEKQPAPKALVPYLGVNTKIGQWGLVSG